MNGDRVRSIALASGCAAFVTVPNLGALLGSGEQTDRYDTVITPPDYAFVVWGPLFAASVVDTVAQCRAPEAAGSRRTGWPLAAAYLLNTTWSLAAQRDRFGATPFLLASATGATLIAQRRLQSVDSVVASTPVSAGALLGWTGLASLVNLAAEAGRRGVRPDSRLTVTASALGVLGVTTGLARVVLASRRGGAAVAGPAVWGLATTAADRSRPTSVRLVAAGCAAVLGAAGARAARRPG